MIARCAHDRWDQPETSRVSESVCGNDFSLTLRLTLEGADDALASAPCERVGEMMADPFPAKPVRAACPSCGTSVLFPRLRALAPSSTVSCDCPRCGRKVSVVNLGAPHPSKARRAAVLIVALVAIAAVVPPLIR